MGMRLVLVASVLLLTAHTTQAQTPADCDFDLSGSVDFSDFLAFAGAYGSADELYDLDRDGTVAFADFLTFTIALLTVSYQAVRAAVSNPADSLRYE